MALTILIWIVLIGVLLVRFVARPLITNTVRERLAESGPAIRPEDVDPGPGNVVPESIQPGSFTISAADANQWIADHRGELQGVDDVRLRFVPGEVQADVTAYGMTSTARAGATVVNGQVVVTNPTLDAPLSMFIDAQPFATLIQDRLNNDLASVGRTVTGVAIEEGQLVITVE